MFIIIIKVPAGVNWMKNKLSVEEAMDDSVGGEDDERSLCWMAGGEGDVVGVESVMTGTGCGWNAKWSMRDDGWLDDLLTMDLQFGGKKVSLYNSICRGFISGDTTGADE